MSEFPLSRRQFLAAFGFSGLVAGWIAWPRERNSAWARDPAADNRSFALQHLKTPRRRALPTGEAELADAFAEVQRKNMPFRVQSSGHCFAGISQSEDALLDLRLMNSVTVDAQTQTVTAGPGAQVGEVNAATATTGLALTAGYCQTMALGGHVSGGGVGVLSRRFGLASDQLMSARLLTADGQVTMASDQENPDLLWALRGGGAASFGIVTQYTLRLREPGPLTLMELRFHVPAQEAPQWLVGWQRLVLTLDPRVSAIVYLATHPDGHIDIRTSMVSALDEPGSEAVFDRVVALGALMGQPSVRFGPYHELANRLWPPGFYGQRTSRFGSDLLGGVVRTGVWRDLIDALLAGQGHNAQLTLEALGGAIDEVPNAATAYAHRGQAQFKVQYVVDRPESGDLLLADMAYTNLTSTLRPHGTGGAFYNYPEVDRPNWGQAYFGENFERLKQVKRRYDPGNVFSHPLSIPPA